MLPQQRIGVVVLTNGHDHAVGPAIANTVFDRLLDRDELPFLQSELLILDRDGDGAVSGMLVAPGILGQRVARARPALPRTEPVGLPLRLMIRLEPSPPDIVFSRARAV